jgi:hypothetical protein
MSSTLKNLANEYLARFNLRIDSLTAQHAETARLLNMERGGHFHLPVFPILPQMTRCDPRPILAALKSFREQTNRLIDPERMVTTHLQTSTSPRQMRRFPTACFKNRFRLTLATYK